MAAFGSHDNCPNCGARMAADQRYCLNCGHRRGEPRLPFMDAVTFMDSMNAPGGGGGTPPPPPPTASGGGSSRWNANAALIAGVATLVLAIGVGFLIGRSGHDSSSQNATPQVIHIEGGTGGGEGEVAEAPVEESSGGGKEATGNEKGGGSKKSKSGGAEQGKGTPETKEHAEEGEHGASKATEETLHPEGEVEFAEPEQELGGSCAKGTAGCSSGGKFEGNFFGE